MKCEEGSPLDRAQNRPRRYAFAGEDPKEVEEEPHLPTPRQPSASRKPPLSGRPWSKSNEVESAPWVPYHIKIRKHPNKWPKIHSRRRFSVNREAEAIGQGNGPIRRLVTYQARLSPIEEDEVCKGRRQDDDNEKPSFEHVEDEGPGANLARDPLRFPIALSHCGTGPDVFQQLDREITSTDTEFAKQLRMLQYMGCSVPRTTGLPQLVLPPDSTQPWQEISTTRQMHNQDRVSPFDQDRLSPFDAAVSALYCRIGSYLSDLRPGCTCDTSKGWHRAPRYVRHVGLLR